MSMNRTMNDALRNRGMKPKIFFCAICGGKTERQIRVIRRGIKIGSGIILCSPQCKGKWSALINGV